MSKIISFLAPLNSILVWLCVAVGEQLITKLNLGGYIPSSSLILRSSFECSPLTKKSISFNEIYIIIMCLIIIHSKNYTIVLIAWQKLFLLSRHILLKKKTSIIYLICHYFLLCICCTLGTHTLVHYGYIIDKIVWIISIFSKSKERIYTCM